MSYSQMFLEQLFSQIHRTVYVKITSLTMDERPQETIQGRATSGSINVDGKSAVRRTCQLSLISETNDINDYYWVLHTKFSLEVGLKNNINNQYPEIIWFPQGIFVISSCTLSRSVNNFTINISGKDKMCLLNGEVGGNLPYEVDFGQWEERDENDNIVLHKYPLQDIIREAVHYYGGEPFHNIVINDLDNRGKELQEYRLDSPMYLIRKATNDGNYIQATLNGGQRIYKVNDMDNDGYFNHKDSEKKDVIVAATTLGALQNTEFDMLITGLDVGTHRPTTFAFSNENGSSLYCATKITYGQTIGYTPIEMTYPGELIAKPGEALTVTLDKIKNMLGNFEYFYDIDGRFIFREQQNYINTSWSPIETTSDNIIYVNPINSKIQFTFQNSAQITTINKNPNLDNLKNDYSVWGTRTTVAGGQVPVHMRYAIDNKPIIYRTIQVSDEEAEALDPKLKGQDSVIYISELAADSIVYETYNNGLLGIRFHMTEDFWDNSFVPDKENIDNLIIQNIHSDQAQLHCDWRELIYQMALDYRKYNHLDDFELKVAQANPTLCPSGRTGYEQYYVDLEGFWRQLYDPSKQNSDEYFPASDQERKYWHKNVYEAPELLNFWFDFLDSDGELFEYSVRNIGSRTKVVNDKDVRAIYYKDTPQILFTKDGTSTNNQNTGYTQISIPQFYGTMFSQSAQGKSAKRAIEDLMYSHSYCSESVTITAIPIYNLEPNQRIRIYDKDLNVDQEYLVSSFNIPLTHNGTMNIQTTKTVDRII